MRLSLLAAAAVVLSASLVAHAGIVTITYGGLTGSQGGSIRGSFEYDNSSTPTGGLYSITSLDLTQLNGINFGGTFTYPQTPFGFEITPGSVTSVPETNGSMLIGTLDMTYDSPFGPLVFDFTFNQDGSASGLLSVPLFSESESYSASQVRYVTVSTPAPPVSVTPEPSGLVLLGTALLGLTSRVRKLRT